MDLFINVLTGLIYEAWVYQCLHTNSRLQMELALIYVASIIYYYSYCGYLYIQVYKTDSKLQLVICVYNY